MRKGVIGGCAFLIVFAVWGTISFSHAAITQQGAALSAPRSATHHRYSAVTHVRAVGIAAIPVQQAGTAGADAGFSLDYARKFITRYGFTLGVYQGSGQAAISHIAFMPAQEASILLHGESVDRPDDALVLYVQLQGPFKLTRAHLMRGVAIPTYKNGVMIFDAHTGNLLIDGANNY